MPKKNPLFYFYSQYNRLAMCSFDGIFFKSIISIEGRNSNAIAKKKLDVRIIEIRGLNVLNHENGWVLAAVAFDAVHAISHFNGCEEGFIERNF